MTQAKCETCHHFITNTVLSANSGECHRRSPRGMDGGGMSVGLPFQENYQAGVISDTLFSEEPVYLYKNNFEIGDEASPLPIGKGLAVGYNSNEISPFICSFGMQVFNIRLCFSRANTGDTTVGAAPILKIILASVRATTTLVLNTFEFVLNPSHIHPFNYANDDFYENHMYSVDFPTLDASWPFAFWIDLDTTSSPDYIAQIRNPMMLIRARRVFAVTNPFSLIDDKTIRWCGDYKPKSNNPSIQCWNCRYFEAANIGVDNSGHCRRNAPHKFDQSAIPGILQPIETSIDFTNLFPLITDGTNNYCGDFSKSDSAIPTPV